MFRTLMLGVALAIGTVASAANDLAEGAIIPPDLLIQNLYDEKLKAEAVSQTQGRAITDQFILNLFNVELLSLYKCTQYMEDLVFNGDVFILTSHGDTKAVMTRTLAQTKDVAMVEARFVVYGEPRKVIFSLTAFGDGWEIDDISSDQGSLRQWIAQGVPVKYAPAKRGPCP